MKEKELKVSVVPSLSNRTECPSCFLVTYFACGLHEYDPKVTPETCDWCKDRLKIMPLSDRKRLERIMSHIDTILPTRHTEVMKMIYHVCLPEEERD